MSAWKVLAGAAAGVGCIVALPIAGPIGAVSAVGAAVAAGAGGITGGIASEMEGEKVEQARESEAEKVKREFKARETQLEKSLNAELKSAMSQLKEAKNTFDAIIAMEAVAISAANCDGEICDAEREQIEMFIKGMSAASMPERYKKKIQSIYDNPPNIREAFQMAKASNIPMDVFDDIIELVANSDEVFKREEEAFTRAWGLLKQVA